MSGAGEMPKAVRRQAVWKAHGTEGKNATSNAACAEDDTGVSRSPSQASNSGISCHSIIDPATFAKTFSDLVAVEAAAKDDDFRISFMDKYEACTTDTPFRPPGTVSVEDPHTLIGPNSPDENEFTSDSEITSGLSSPPQQAPSPWGALLNLTREGRTDSEIQQFMSHATASSATSSPMHGQHDPGMAFEALPVSPDQRTQAERNTILKNFLCRGPDIKGNVGSLWDDEYLSLIQGVFFRACIRPPCLQDDRLDAAKFQFQMARAGRCGLVVLLMALCFGRDTAGPALHLPLAVALALPCSLYAANHYIGTLHRWFLLALLARSVLLLFLRPTPTSWVEAMTACEVWPVVTTCAGAVLIEVRRWLSARHAAQLVGGDARAYAEAWNKVLEDDREKQHLARVCKLCDQIRTLGPEGAMQCVVVGECWSKKRSWAGAGEEQGKLRTTVRVQSIDQLHQQSMILQPMLRARVQWWASRSHGWFKAKPPHALPARHPLPTPTHKGGGGKAEEGREWEWVKWDEEDGDACSKIAWAETKPFRRSIAKTAKAYHFEVARVCDVTRESIWFESLQDLEACLMQISWDRWAQIVHVKNGLGAGASAHATTGGFPFVKLLLRLATPQARSVGLDGHVCEVLLVLKAVEEAKLSGWHARYTAARDLSSTPIPTPFPRPLLSSFFAQPRPPHSPHTAPVERKREQDAHDKLEEEVARVASQEEAARELDWRRCQRSASSARGVEREAMLQEYAEAMKDYLWGVNHEVYGTIGKRRSTVEAATHSSTFAGCFRMKQPLASVLCFPLLQALVGATGLLLFLLPLSDLVSLSRSSSASAHMLCWSSAQACHRGDGRVAGLVAVGGLVMGVTLMCAAMLGWLKMAARAVEGVKRLLLLHMLPHLLAIALLIADGHTRHALLVTSWVASVGVWVLLLHFSPHYVLEAFVASGAITLLSALALQPSPQLLQPGWGVGLEVVGAMCIGIGVGCKALVMWNERCCEQAFQRDVQVYDATWKEMVEQDRMRGVLDKLKFCTDQIHARQAGGGGVLRQRCLEWDGSLDHEAEALDPGWWRACALWESSQLFARAAPTQSIDQLYAQAELASVVMRHKIKHWAVGSRGLFLRKGGSEGLQRRQWARAAELLSGEQEDIMWGPLKRESRAIEKAFRCYGGDVSRLLDLSRHLIVFEEPEHILQCLELLRADPDVHVLRIKNELHPSQQGASGYRQILINVAIVTEETQRMGVSMHVSEIQLLPLQMALAKTDDGHRRYVIRRNARGE